MSARIPFDSLALGFKGRIKQFVWGNGSAIYINPKENIRSGGDYDIDQLSVYYRKFKSAFEKSSDNSIDGNINVLMDNIHNYYKNPKYSGEIYGVTGVTKIKDAISKFKEKQAKENKTTQDLAENKRYHNISTLIELSELESSGDDAIGILASAVSAFSYTTRLMRYNNGNRFKLTAEEVLPRKENASGFLQGALDNKKEMIIGEFGVSSLGVNMLVGMTTQGLGYEEILDVTHSSVGKFIFRQIATGMDIFEAKKSFPLLIENSYDFIASRKDAFIEYVTNDLNFEKDSDKKAAIKAVQGIKSRKPEVALEASKAIFNILFSRAATLKKLRDKKNVTEEKKSEYNKGINTIYKDVRRFSAISPREINENPKHLAILKEAYIQGEALRQFGQFVKLRNGIPGNHAEMLMLKRNLEQTLGQSLKDFIDPNKALMSPKQRLLKYTSENNYYRSLSEEEQAIQKKYMNDVVKAMDIPNMINNQIYFKGLLANLDNHSEIMSESFFIYNKIFEVLENETMLDNNKVHGQFTTEINVFANIANDLIVDNTLSNINENFSLSIPTGLSSIDQVSNSGYIRYTKEVDYLSDLDLSNRQDQRLFLKHFPEMMNDIKLMLEREHSNREIESYFEAIGIPLTSEELDNISQFSFFNYLSLGGNDGHETLEVDSAINSNDAAIRMARDRVKEFPKKLRTMFEVYSLIASKGTYSKKGLSEVLTKDLTILTKESLEANKDNIIKKVAEELENLKLAAGLNKEIKANFNKDTQAENPKRFVMYQKKISNFKKIRTSGIVPGLKNESGDYIVMDHTAKYYNLQTSLNDQNTLTNIQTIKLKNEDDVKLFEMIENRKKDPKSSDLLIITFNAPHNYINGTYITDTGVLVDVSENGPFSIFVSLSSQTYDEMFDAKTKAQQQMNSFIPINLGATNEMLKSDVKLSLIKYANKAFAKASTFNHLFNKDGSVMSADYKAGSNAEGIYKVNVKPIADNITPASLKDVLVSEGVKVKDMKSVLGIYYLRSRGLYKSADELEAWFDSKSKDPKDSKFFIFVRQGKLVKKNISEEEALNQDFNNSNNNCKK